MTLIQFSCGVLVLTTACCMLHISRGSNQLQQLFVEQCSFAGHVGTSVCMFGWSFGPLPSFHVNSSRTIPFSHSVSVEGIRVFSSMRGDEWYVLGTTQNGECVCLFLVPRLTPVERPSSLLWTFALVRGLRCSAHVARYFPSCVVTSLCDSSDDFPSLAQGSRKHCSCHVITNHKLEKIKSKKVKKM